LDTEALFECVTSLSCLVTQTSTGLIVGSLLFLVATGLTLIFGVLGIVNFAHGSLYMLGAYIALSAFRLTDSFIIATLVGAIGVGAFSLFFERFFMRRVYDADVLMQLLVCYAFILILDDAVKIIWGSEFQSMGMPSYFQEPPVFLAGMALALWLLLNKTIIGKIVRAAASNPSMTSALGLNTSLIYAGVFAFGGALAGLAGALAAPVRSMSPGMGFSILIESFIVTVIGGMGSVSGALVGALLIGLIRSFGSIGFPFFIEGVMFVAMAAILVLKPSGIMGKDSH
jgi:branched-chain amino acid transport system permease protein